MENRLHLYYPGNTVKAPHPGRKRKRKISRQPKERPLYMTKALPHVKKTVATSKCVWCDYPFGQYMVVCLHCFNCQYCGFLSKGNMGHCMNCDNQVNDEIANTGQVLRAQKQAEGLRTGKMRPHFYKKGHRKRRVSRIR